MRLWTLQGIEIYEMLQRDGVAYCTKPSWGDEPQFMRAYHWMADQMRRRIGEPPIKGIEFPMWAWYPIPKDVAQWIKEHGEGTYITKVMREIMCQSGNQ